MGAVDDLTRIARDCLMPARKADCFTLVAEWCEQGCEAVIGEASYGFDRTSGSGEFAISVADRFQRRGLGSALLGALQSRAVSLGYLDLFGETFKANDEMKTLRAGPALKCRARSIGARCGSTSGCPDERAWSGAAGRPRTAVASHSATISPDPPNSLGKSFSFGKPSRIGSTVSA
jgi:GNAT superfamily N-acetyltransferase